MLCFFLKIRWWTKSHLTSGILCSLFWISWTLKMGQTDCSETAARIYHSTLCNISEEWRSHLTIWHCRAWFDSALSSSESASLVVVSSVPHMQTEYDLTYLSNKFKVKPSSGVWAYMVHWQDTCTWCKYGTKNSSKLWGWLHWYTQLCLNYFLNMTHVWQKFESYGVWHCLDLKESWCLLF
jgi:hypothetical protein